jgi:hypothetical protein
MISMQPADFLKKPVLKIKEEINMAVPVST